MTTNSARQPKGIPVGGQFAATAHPESDVSLAPEEPKKPKRRVTTVTFPDGTVDKRTSENKVYTHAVVKSAEVPELVIANREHVIAREEQRIKDIDEALALEKPNFRIKRRFNFRNEDPDISYDGKPSYHGFEAILLTADGKRQLHSTHCNSKGISEGVFDYETGKYDGSATQHSTTSIKASVRDHQKHSREAIEKAKSDIEKVKAGTYDLGKPGVVRWSSREDLAVKAATGEFNYDHDTRRASVVPVDPA
jgi:hypothetical protein